MSKDNYVTTNWISERLQVHLQTVRNWIYQGKLPATRAPGTRKWLVKESDVWRMMGR